IWTQRGRRIL
ncbi:syd family protein, partial [Vibrio parahaemolyticus V-223/04]